MTATQVQIRRGTSSQCDAATLASSEIVRDTTNNRLRIHDASRVGGWPVPNFSDIQKQVFQAPTVGGSANAITLTNSVPLISYSTPCKMVFKATATNTGSVTVNVDGIGSKNILKMKAGTLSALEAGDIVNGVICEITYDGTQFQIKALDEGAGGTKGWNLLSIATGGGASYDFIGNITSDYRNYAFVFENVLPVNDDNALMVRVRRSGQGTFDSSVSDYVALNAVASASAMTVSDSGTHDSVILSSSVRNTTFGSGLGMSGIMNAHGLGQSNTVLFQYDMVHNFSTSVLYRVMGGGYRRSASALDGVRVQFASGNIASGSVYMYGMRSSL